MAQHKKFLVIGGSNGVGASISKHLLANSDEVIICDYLEPCFKGDFEYHKFDLFKDNISELKTLIENSDGIFITAGFGRVAPIETFSDTEIRKTLIVNGESIIRILNLCLNKLFCEKDFICTVITSIAGAVSSPLFAAYSAAKASVYKFVEAANVEIGKKGFSNRITNVVATSFEGTSFNGGETNFEALRPLTAKIIDSSVKHEELCYLNEDVVKSVIQRYNENPKKFGSESYDYKVKNNRINSNSKIKVGYLSGTFDLFHIGHLNLLRNAKQYCDYLIVGVHKDASHKNKPTFIPFEERIEIIKHIDYVDEAVECCKEDSDAWDKLHFDLLFVGSDYKGTERFNRYENYFKDKGVKIIYFPYTQTTNSTELRKAISKKNDE